MPTPLMFEYEQASAAPSSAPETDTKPNPVVQTGDIEPAFVDPESKAEEATQPIDMEIIAYDPPQSADVEEAASETQEREEVEEAETLVPEVAAIAPEPVRREARAVDTSGVSVFEIFGLRKPSEAGGQLLEDELAAERAERRRNAESSAKLWIDDLPGGNAKPSNSGASAEASMRAAEGGKFDEGAASTGQIVGQRRRMRMRQTKLRSHNLGG